MASDAEFGAAILTISSPTITLQNIHNNSKEESDIILGLDVNGLRIKHLQHMKADLKSDESCFIRMKWKKYGSNNGYTYTDGPVEKDTIYRIDLPYEDGKRNYLEFQFQYKYFEQDEEWNDCQSQKYVRSDNFSASISKFYHGERKTSLGKRKHVENYNEMKRIKLLKLINDGRRELETMLKALEESKNHTHNDQKNQLLERLKITLRNGTDMDNNSDSGDLIKIIEQLNNKCSEVRAQFKKFDASEGLIWLCIPNYKSKDALPFALECVQEAHELQRITNANIITCGIDELRSRLETEQTNNRLKIKWIHFIGHGDAKLYGRQFELLLTNESGTNIVTSKRKTIVDCLKLYAPNAELISFNACTTLHFVADCTSGSNAIKYSWGWATPCVGNVAKIYSTTFFTNWKLVEKSIEDALACAKIAVETVEHKIGKDETNNITISEPKFAWGDPSTETTLNKSRCVTVGIPVFLERDWQDKKPHELPPYLKTWSNEIHKTKFNELLQYVCSNDEKKICTVTGVRACGGAGKTVLCLQLARHPLVYSTFKHGVVYIKAGQEATSLEILRSFFLQLKDEKKLFVLNAIDEKDFKDSKIIKDDTWFESKLNKYLQSKTLHMLVIIDDIWSKKCFIKLSSVLQANATKSRIVMSTRNSKLLDGKDKKEVCLDFLKENEAIAFLKDQVKADGWNQQWDDGDLLHQIYEKTSGLVLFLSSIAGKLDFGDAGILNRILKSLEKDLEDVYDEAFSDVIEHYGKTGIQCLAMTVDWLDNGTERGKKLQTQYIMLGIYPEDTQIPYESLKILWELDDVGDVIDIIHKLSRQSLLVDNRDEKYVTMHNLQCRYVIERLKKGKDGVKIDNAQCNVAKFLSKFPRVGWSTAKNINFSYKKLTDADVLAVGELLKTNKTLT
eukprot:g3734.t1